MDIRQTHALVTGGARRIGRAIVLGLAEQGGEVTIHFHTSDELAEETKRKAEDAGGTARIMRADLANRDDVTNLIPNLCRETNPPDVLINNASVFDHTSFAGTSPEHWQNNLSVNLTAPVMLMQSFSRHLTGGEPGRIINLLDWRASSPQPDQFAYSISKSGLAAATRAAARELAPEITVNGIAPGPVLPPEGTDEAELDHIAGELPAGRWGDPDDIIHAVRYLIRSSSFVTGDILYVDGGRHLR